MTKNNIEDTYVFVTSEQNDFEITININKNFKWAKGVEVMEFH